jgi:mannose-6-phosphate isomerase-like protein (cupin superfamily)
MSLRWLWRRGNQSAQNRALTDGGADVEGVYFSDAMSYQAAASHHGMVAFRLQGGEASGAETMVVGLSQFLPGGGAERSSSTVERIYIVVDGVMTVSTDNSKVDLGRFDSCVIPAGEMRTLVNNGKYPASMLVLMPPR